MSAPVLSQAITAGSGLLVQVVAARTLGLAGYGSFAIGLAVLASLTSLFGGYVGDGLTVLDRHERETRSALVSSALFALALAGCVAVVTALTVFGAVGAQPVTTTLCYAAMVVLRLSQETARRLLIARREFGRLVGCDSSYLLVTAAGLFPAMAAGVAVTLWLLFAAMALGGLAAAVVGCALLPRSELVGLRPGLAGMRRVAAFASWRSLHATLRPGALLVARIVVANFVSLSAVGVLEAARLVVAPLQVVINGAAGFLLSRFAAAEHRRERREQGLAGTAGWLLVALTAGGGAVLAALSGPLGHLMTGAAVPPLLVLGWVAYLAAWAAGLPAVSELVARRRSRQVFLIRGVDSLLGLTLVTVMLLVLAGPAASGPVVDGSVAGGVTAVPWLMALGGCYAIWRLLRLRRCDRYRGAG